MENEDKIRQKIAIIGLSNAGKTSVINCFKREFGSLQNLQPTSYIERTNLNFIGNELIFWDFGGQQKYRETYIKEADVHFDAIDYLFFVVDVQDARLLEPSKKYFEAIYHLLISLSPDAQLIILFHKFDPELEQSPELIKFEQDFLKGLEQIIKDRKDQVFMYRTSIFNPISVVQAISKPLFYKRRMYKTIEELLHNLVKAYDCLFGYLFTEEFFEMGYYVAGRFQFKQINEYLKSFFKIAPNLMHSGKNVVAQNSDILYTPFFELDCNEYKILASKFKIAYKDTVLPFELIIGFDEKSDLDINSFKEVLQRFTDNLETVFKTIDFSDMINDIVESSKPKKK